MTDAEMTDPVSPVTVHAATVKALRGPTLARMAAM